MIGDKSGESLVAGFWAAIQRRDWDEARRALHSQASMIWPVTAEKFNGADSIIRVNAIYPEGWSIDLNHISRLEDGRILTIVKVEHPPGAFFAISLFRLKQDLVEFIEEYWSTMEEPPDWRTSAAIPGLERLHEAVPAT